MWASGMCQMHIYSNSLMAMCMCVMCATREDDVSPRRWYASEDVNLYSQNGAHGHQAKGGQSCADGM